MSRLHTHRRHAFTLLEVLLALGLTVIVMALVGSALTTTLKLVESGRVRTERDQLARAILSKIADDVRSSVRYEPFDPSGMMKINTSSSSSSSQSGQSSSSTSNSTNSSNSTGNKSSNSSTNSTNSSQSSNSTSASSNSSSGNTSSDSSSSSSSTPAVVSTTITGLVGDDSGLQIDLGRIPRLDEYVAAQSQSSAPVTDVRRVMYYLANSASIVSTTGAGSSATSGTGLIRSEANHATAQYSADTGGDPTSAANGSVVAPEVLALEFSYFDGSEWVSTWDTTTYNGLPQLIKISIALADPAHTKPGDTPSFSSIADAADKDPDNVYSVVVRLPACDPIPSASGSASTSSSNSGTSTSGASSSSGTSTSSGNTSTSAN